jgi:hypothetical protein
MIQRTFNCTILQLYAVCRLGWQSCAQYLADFADFKLKYTSVFINERLAEVEAAAILPDDQTRTSDTETFRLQLQALNAKNLANWQKLKRYMADAYPTDLQKPKLEAAGQNHYEKAGKDNWQSTTGLLIAASSFIAANLAELTANLNMPPAFQATFNADKISFEKKLAEFLDSQKAATISTDDKGIANNDIFAKLMSMFEDGQQIFKDNEAVKKQFVFEQVLGMISGPGAAGIRGIVTDAVTNLPVTNAVVAIDSENKTAVTDLEGKYIISPIASGTYKVVITAKGYQPQEIAAQEIKVGTVSTVNIALTPAA